jgi:hypothetical protein
MAGQNRNYDFLVRHPTPLSATAPQELSFLLTQFPLTDQAPPNRRFGRWQVMLSAAIQRRQLYALLHHHHWH